MKRLVTIQDISCVGKCSLTVALPIISAMGAGNKLDPTKLSVMDIRKTSYDPIAKKIRKMVKDEKIKVNTDKFKNDFSVINSKDDALTALIHLGYLSYDNERKKAFIPNFEVATAFHLALGTRNWNEIADTAIKQIKEKRYAGNLKGYSDEILLVGVNYDKETKKHECIIESINNYGG